MFTIFLSKETFKFSCSHFTIFSAEKAERLHGHNYQMCVELNVSEIDANVGMAFDFNLVKPLIREFCDKLDERILIPTQSPHLRIQSEGAQVDVGFARKKYSFPAEDTLSLPLCNITSEELARHACRQLAESLRAVPHWQSLTVHIEETRGQSVSYAQKR